MVSLVAIGPVTLLWMEALESQYGVFRGARVVEMGPQGLSNAGDEKVCLKKRFPEGWWGRDLYQLLGSQEYSAFDLLDPRAEPCDFNNPPPGRGDASVVTNFGTSEHVINQMALMRFIHETSDVGGVMLHSLPTAGGRDHGFFNYHPCFFWDLARANKYDIMSFEYIPHYRLQNDFGDPPVFVDLLENTNFVGVRTITNEAALKKALMFFFASRKKLLLDVRTIAKCVRRPRGRLGPFFDLYRAGDYVHVAMRKTSDAKFVPPVQGLYEGVR